MKARFTDEQIIQMIKEQEAGERTADVCRRYGISQGTFYKYKSKYGGMEPSDAKKLRALESENARLKKLLAEQMLERGLVRHWSEDNGRARC
jgi:putative transposase